MTCISQAQFAARHGVSRKTVTIWKRQGYLVLEGNKVDVEKSDHSLRDCGKGNFSIKRMIEGTEGSEPQTRARTAKPQTLRAAPDDAAAKLLALDWTLEGADWSEDALDDRAKRAALCIGAIAVRLDGPVDPHRGNAGGFQLRGDGPSGTSKGEVLDGHGFELTNTDIIRTCRDLVDEDPEACERIDFLDALALPISAYDLPKDGE